MSKNIVLGVCGGIAAYKACDLCSQLVKNGFSVQVIMTQAATEFVQPLTFASLTKNEVVIGLFDSEKEIQHISIAQKADLFCIVPATANTLAKLAVGIADDFLTTCAMATKAPLLIAPAMNTQMLLHPATQNNIDTLKRRGCYFVDSQSGMLACGIVGQGRLAPIAQIVDAIIALLGSDSCNNDNGYTSYSIDTPIDTTSQVDGLQVSNTQDSQQLPGGHNIQLQIQPPPIQDLLGKTVLVTCGATTEPIDSVRHITNRSSGKMGLALAQRAKERGATVILIKGKTTVAATDFDSIDVGTTDEMFDAVCQNLDQADYIIMAAAPSDYKVANYTDKKIKYDKVILQLVKNIDIAAFVGQNKKDKKLAIFAAESEDLLDNAKRKLYKKNADMVVANDITQVGAGFDVDTNIVTIIQKDGTITELEQQPKIEIANHILDILLSL